MIAGEHLVDCLSRVDDHDAVFWRCSEKDVIARFNIVNPPRGSRDNDAGFKGDSEKSIWGREDHDPAQAGNYFKLIPGLPAESADDITILDPPGCVYRPDTVKHCGVA
ncbi:MAG TPA: hypothetical protein VK284_14505 [Streptosporangiaceae bacterium]|nr:hypothetical protein [Streptosporangiaceae bacterium]